MKNKRYIATMVGLLLMFGAGTSAYGQIVKGKVFGGGKLAKVNGGTGDEAACNVTIKSGSVYGKVYGAGEGVKIDEDGYDDDVAKVTGDTKVNLEPGRGGGGTAWQDVFGGGALAKVAGDTHVSMSGGHIAANLFGGGEGDIKDTRDGGNLVITSADITGNTNVDITGGDIIWDRTSMASDLSVTTFTYTKTIPGESGTETYTTTDAEETAEKIKASFESAGYTSVSVVSGGDPVDGVYSYAVTRTPPAVVKTEEVLSANTTRIDQLLAAGYVKDDGKTIVTPLAEGEIVYWDTDVRTADYVNESDASHKIHNELFYDEVNKKFRIKHNIFGGGYIACRVGTYSDAGVLQPKGTDAEGNPIPTGLSRVSMVSGMFGADLMGTEQWKQCYDDKQDPHFYVFGGGYGAYTSVGMTQVQIGVDEEITTSAFESDEQWAKPGQILLGEDTAAQRAKFGKFGDEGTMLSSVGGTDDDPTLGIADQSYGEPGYTILGVLGGGYAGIVTGDTDVRVGGNTFMSRIYGGGYGQLAAYNELSASDKIYKVGTNGKEYDREDLGMVMGNTYVKTDGGFIHGDVFGGGAGVEWDGNADHDFTMGEVKGATEVEITGATFVKNSVYGGGDVANVLGTTVGTGEDAPKHTTTVTVKSGTVIENVFGGGSGRQSTKVQSVTDNAVSVGKIVGETLVTIEDTKDEETNIVTSSPVIYGGIYGGGAYGQIVKTTGETPTGGNTYVNINGGKIGGDIFGGGLGKVDGSNITSANIAGNTNVTVNGGSYLWDVVVDANGNEKSWENVLDSHGKEMSYKDVVINMPLKDALANPAEYLEKVQNLFDPIELLFKNKATGNYTDHNIYGGGNTACVSGQANVTINHGMFDDDLGYFGDSPTCTPGGILRYLVRNNTQHPQFSVLGGGYGQNTTVASTDVKLQMGKADVTGYDNTADNAAYEKLQEKLDADFAALSEDKKNELYGGTDGPNVKNRYVTSRMAWSYGVPNHSALVVAGGGMAGYVTGNTSVTLSDHSEAAVVFGGGIGLQPKRGETATGEETYGQVGGNATVDIQAGVVSASVYGGGAGIESVKVDNTGTVLPKFGEYGYDEATYAAASYVDFVDMARVLGTTNVTIGGSTPETLIYGSVYGGGDVANVGVAVAAGGKDVTTVSTKQQPFNSNGTVNADFTAPQSTVTVSGGCVFGEIFGGGSGRTIDMCSLYDDGDSKTNKYADNDNHGYKKVGAVYGNTRVIIKNPADPTNATMPWTWSRIYGGGSYGKIYGNTDVQIQGGNIGYNVFGAGVGFVGSKKSTDSDDIPVLSSADVMGNANLRIDGGEFCLSQMWNNDTRAWYPANKDEGGNIYSAQYDPELKKFNINHNLYAGSRNCGKVLGDTYLTMTKGLVNGQTALGHDYTGDFFAQPEWKNIYEKIGSPHFCVFGAGYGENTTVGGDTHVNIAFTGTAIDGTEIDAAVAATTDEEEQTYKLFKSYQSIMDVIGGGYSGQVLGKTNVDIDGETFIRRAFGGSFYAPVGQTNITVHQVSADDIFGGGMMGDVTGVTGTTLAPEQQGRVNLRVGTPGSAKNDKIFITNNVYGGNDVSGEVTGQITASIFGGKIYNNVYGAGNGNYLYALNDKVEKVTTHEYYEANGQTYDLVYEVPLRSKMDFNVKSATDAQKIVNINTYRPMAENVVLNIAGTISKPLTIGGNVFGGGNTATVSSLAEDHRPSVTMNIGSYCTIGGVFMGADGEAMFQEKSGFMGAFQNINGVDLSNPIDWLNDPLNRSISEDFLPVAKPNRPKVYPHVLDLYFQPVEMSVQPMLNWVGSIATDGTLTGTAANLTNTTIGTFVCGGNRGNMNVEPWNGTTANYGGNVESAGQIVNYQFPAGLTIQNRIVGGCNEANYTLGKVTHVGGYLLGGREHEGTEINLLVECQFAMPKGMTSLLNGDKPLTDSEGNPVEQRNVYGGCYKSGTIYGDINIDFRSSMLTSNNVGSDRPSDVAKTYFGSEIAMGNVYGAGYGSESYVYGDVKVTVNPNTVTMSSASAKGMKKDAAVDNDAYAAMSVYGGGQQGNVIGNTTVRVLNGHIGKSAVGGSYAGYMWGSTQVLVGYPTYYKAQKGGKYKMFRADKWNVGDGYKNFGGSDVVKQEIYLMPGDIVSEEVFNAIKAYDTKNSTSQATTGADANFSAKVVEAPANWDNINITIDEAAYGGGYSLASGSSVAAGTYTVKKYDSTMNLDGDFDMESLTNFVNHEGNNTTKDYGGNTTVLVWDNNAATSPKDHIKISTQTMKQVTPEEGADLFGYYVANKDGSGNITSYRYIYQEGEYFYTKETDKGAQYFQQAFESDSEGGMYGDGHLSFAEGFRTGELVGYGFAGYRPNGALVINTFQRMDILRIKDCAVAVLGARDYTVNEVSTTPYSLARIGELHMEAENVTNFSSGALAATTATHSRNYLGLSNNIHYLGAVNSNVDFNAKYHYGNKDDKGGADDNKAGAQNTTTYREEKQAYVTAYKSDQNDAEFQKRNDGTAANMIGISSGYAMKVQNVKTTDAKGAEEYFYGPIVGVVEMNLIDVREDEGGGYVYADNIHHRDASLHDTANYDNVPATNVDDEDFLETSGNFVFPYDKVKNRYIVDDCFPTDFSGHPATAEAHYWYVTGYNYYYNAHITGYTYKSDGDAQNMLKFDSDNDNLLTLTGAKEGQQIALQSLKWRSVHPATDGFEKCDLETPKMKDAVEQTTGKGNNASSTDGGHFIYDHYNLFVGTANSKGKYAVVNEVIPANGTDVSTGYYTDEDCTIAATGTADGTIKYYQKMSYWANLPLTENLSSDANRKLTNSLSKESPTLTFQLTDNVDNSGNEYFQKYMVQPCNATIVLTCPAIEGDGVTPIKGYVPISYFFTRDGEAPNYTYTKMDDNTQLTAGTDYYYFGNGNDYHAVNSNDLYYYHKAQQRYVSVKGDAALNADKPATYYTTVEEYNTAKGTTLTAEKFNELPEAAKIKTPAEKAHEAGPAIAAADLISGSQDYTFYAYAPRVFTYTVYLTIDYVQGPDVSGNIKIYNCALPGEKIKIDKGTVTINSDVSMSQTSAMWKIGDWRFDQAHPYDPEAEDNKTDEMLKDVEYSEQDGCIYVPAYYFMNGYPVQYLFTVNGIDHEFPVPMNENGQDKLLVHNYHRMKPRNADGENRATVDFKLDEALKRINTELAEVTAGTRGADDVLPEPRIYIADASDLNELPRFLGEKAITGYDSDENPIYGEVGSKYDFGNHMQFHLLNDIVVNNVGISNLQGDHYADKDEAQNFKGTLNGNGYVISDLGVKKGEFTAPTYLFAANNGNIYNLGLKQGVITKGDAPVNGTKYPLYHTSYTWSNKTVYRMDGTAVATTADGAGNTYTENDWRYGKVTFDLNEYYLDRRKGYEVDGGQALAKSLRINNGGKETYVEDLFHNGDYLYARWQTASSEYLRTSASQYDANYNSQTSYHRFSLTDGVLTHPVDESRAVYDESRFSHYAPLYEGVKQNSTLATSEVVKNDYLFFGQKLDSKTKAAKFDGKDEIVNVLIPEHIDSDVKHDVSLMNNRVYRAGGYYKSRVTGEPYSTSGDAFFYNRAAYAHDNGITAIDFYGNYSTSAITDWYSPMVDYPTVNLASMDRANGVTRNLLVYANKEDVNDGGALKKYVYDDKTSETDIKMHVMKPVVTAAVAPEPEKVTPTADYLHLVERTADGKDAEGNVCVNNDFDAPIQFNVAERAWYTRQPAYYAESNNDAWEGIALPFTAKKVVASLNGEISHFYGTPTGDELTDPKENIHTLHHEYWLRGLTTVAGDKATYQRPGVFNHADMTDAAFDYTFSNTWFADTYNAKGYNSSVGQNNWYTTSHEYTAYLPLTADIPYIVSFPGNRFYEFDLSSNFYYAKMGYPKDTKNPQTVTFSSDGATTIKVTSESQKTITASGYDSKPTYLAITDAPYGIGNGGTSFRSDYNAVLPFRTYMAKSQQSGAKYSVIYITGDVETIIESRAIEHGDPADGQVKEQTMKAYSIKHSIIIDSEYDADIIIYTAGGQVARAVHVLEGNNVYSGFSPGVYLINGKKLVVR